MSSSPDSSSSALIAVATGAAFISTAAAFVTWGLQAGVGATAIGAWRCLIASAVLFVLARIFGAPLWPRRKVVFFGTMAGLCFAGDLFVWHRSIDIVGSGLATILGNTQLFWTAVLAWVIYKAPLSQRFIAAAAIAFVGVTLLVGIGSDVEFSPVYVRGVMFGLATGLTYAGYVLCIQRATLVWVQDLETDVPAIARSMIVLAWTTLVCGTILATVTLIEGHVLAPPSTNAWLVLIGLALVPQVLGWVTITSGLQRIPAARGALILLTQPVLATIWGALFFHEYPQPIQLVGAALTIGAIYLGSVSR